MDTAKKIDITFYTILSIVFILLILSLSGVFNQTIEVGQHWQEKDNVDNPFKEILVYDYFVIEIKDDYVLYVREHNSRIDTMSQKTKYFHYDKELILELEE